MRKSYTRGRKVITFVMFFLGIITTVGIGIILSQSNIAPTSADAATATVTIKEYCIYKSGVTVQLGTITVKENNVGYGKQCPPAKNKSPLSYKRITRTTPTSAKKVKVKYTYWSGGLKTFRVDPLPSAYNLSTPMANATISFYEFR